MPTFKPNLRTIKHWPVTLLLVLCIHGKLALAEEDVKKPAANFTLKSQHGKNIKLSELRGQVVVLNFWASWCGTCIQQFPILDRYYQKNKNRDFKLLSINIDDDRLKAERLVQKRHFNYPVLFDDTNQVSRLYAASDLPTLFIIDKDGMLRYTLDSEQIKQQKVTQQVIEELLNE